MRIKKKKYRTLRSRGCAELSTFSVNFGTETLFLHTPLLPESLCSNRFPFSVGLELLKRRLRHERRA